MFFNYNIVKKRYEMKKPGLIITETIFSLILAASVAAVTVLAVDLKTNKFGLDKFNPFAPQSSASDVKEKDKQSSQKQEDKKASEAVSEKEASQEPVSSGQPSAQPSEEPVSAPEESKEEPSQQSEAEKKTIKLVSEPADLKSQPKELVDTMKKYGYTLDNIISGDRIILVDTNSTGERTRAIVYCYQKSDKSNYWWNVAGDGKAITDQAFIGENGSDYDVAPGSKKTPGGIMTIGEGFYIGDKPNTDYPMFKITEDTYWVTDPKSKFYNQKVEDTDKKDWSSAEHMITSEKSYKTGLVVNYNTPDADSKKGSAIFLHCGSDATEGCIALPDDVMKTIVEWLDKDSDVSIFITV